MKLNIGAGYTRYEGFVNCDYDSNCSPDYLFNVETDVWPFDDNSVDEVRAFHVLEHMGEGYFHFLQELYRVCKDGAVIEVRVPHHRHDDFYHDPTHRRPITHYGLYLFNKMFNCTDTTTSSKLGIFYDVDFRIIEHSVELDPRFKFLESQPPEVLEYYAYTLCNVYNECRFKLQVHKLNPVVYWVTRATFELLGRMPTQADIDHFIERGLNEVQIKEDIMNSPEYIERQHHGH